MEFLFGYIAGAFLFVMIAAVVILAKHKVAEKHDFFHDRVDVYMGVLMALIASTLWPLFILVFLIIYLANWIVKKLAIKSPTEGVRD